MGHDIYGYSIIRNAYLRRSAFDKDNGRLYSLLDCEDCNGGVSGTGETRYFSREELEEALESAIIKEWNEETEFLKDLIKDKEQERFVIRFG